MSFPDQRPAARPLRRLRSALALAAAVVALGPGARAQLRIENAEFAPYEPETLIREVFLGGGVEVTAVDFDGKPEALGYFEGGSAGVGIDRGIVLTTGISASRGVNSGADTLSEVNAQYDNNSAVRDPNLERIVPFVNPSTGADNIMNVARYRITFRPKGDRVSFRYVFASEEYPEYVCSEFNDLFGFFISGPGFAGPYENGAENIALVPGTTLPVAINTINGGTPGPGETGANCQAPGGSLLHAAYYRDNTAAGGAPAYDGLTTVLTASADVIPCQEYTIELTIGDVADPGFDSGVFLEAKSFATNTLDVTLATPALGAEIAEACDRATLTFTYPDVAAVDRTVTLVTSGSATSGLDYVPLPPAVTIPAGQRSASLAIEALADGLAEGPETVTVTVPTDACTTEDFTVRIVDPVIAPVPQLRDTTVCSGEPVPLDATLPTTTEAPRRFESTAPFVVIVPGTPNTQVLGVAGVSPDQLTTGALTQICVDLQHGRAENVDMFLYSPAGRALELTTDNGSGATDGRLCFRPDAATRISDPGAAFPWTGDYRPEGDWADLLDPDDPINGSWTLQVTNDANGGVGLVRSWSLEFAPPYAVDYAWTPTVALSCGDCPAPVASPTASTTYTVVATDSYGCQADATVDVDVFPPLPTPAVSCAPAFEQIAFSWPLDPYASGYALSTDGGATWLARGLATDTTIAGLSAGQAVTLEVRVTGPCGTAVGAATCTTPLCPVITATAVATDASCGGYADGSIAVTAGGGAAPYTFTLDGLSNASGAFTGLTAGAYAIQVVDDNGCSALANVSVGEPAAATSTVTVAPSTVCGEPAIATATASGGGGGPYAYLWSDGQTGPVARFRDSGTFYVEVSDGGCLRRDSAVVTMPDTLLVTFAVDSATCHDLANGAIEVLASGGTPTYEYDFGSGWQTASAATGLAAGTTHAVRVRDARGCARDTSVTIEAPAPMTLDLSVTPVACAGEASGAVVVDVRQPQGTPVIAWPSLGEGGQSVSDLAAGTYPVEVTDAAGCTASAVALVTEPDPLAATWRADSLSCFGGADGRVEVDARGGTRPYTYALDGSAPQDDSIFAGLPAGTYVIDVRDANACLTRVTAAVGAPLALAAAHQVTPVRCAGDADGQIDLLVTGGRRPYEFAWSDGGSAEDRSGLPAGTYEVVVTDASQCTLTHEVSVGEPEALRLNASVTEVSCYGDDDGAVAVAPTGGREPYDYTWDGPNDYAFFGPAPTALLAGDYRLRFRDRDGCGIDTLFVVTEPEEVAIVTYALDSVCFGASDGRAIATAVGGTAPLDYLWGNGERGETAEALSAGAVTVTVTDANGCVYRDGTEVFSLPPIGLSLAQTPVACYRDSNGVAAVTRVDYGGVERDLGGFTFRWRGYPDSVGAEITGRGGREELVVTVADARGCRAVDSIVVAEPPPLSAVAERVADVSCRGRADGVAEVRAVGGDGAYRYAWLASGRTTATNAGLGAGTYAVTATDGEGCADTTEVTIREPDALVNAVAATKVNCFSDRSGTVAVTTSGGNVPYAYTWSHGPRTASLDSVAAGRYVLTTEDARGCLRRDTAEIERVVPVALDVDVEGVTCAGDVDGSILATATGGTGPYTYALDGESAGRVGDYRYLPPGDYTVTAFDRYGCPSPVAAVAIEAPEPLRVEAGDLIEVELGERVGVAATVSHAEGAVRYRWTPRDTTLFACDTCAVTEVTGRYQGTIRVDVTDERGCSAGDVVQVRVTKAVTVLVPTGFRPDGSGEDDRLVVHGKTGTRVETFEVFNRWGELVYAAADFPVNSFAHGWDGSYRGAFAPGGTYLWRVGVTFIDGTVETATGQTTLIR